MQVAAQLEALGQFVHQFGLKQAALVVFGFVPRVWKENVHTVQRVLWQHVVDHLDRVMPQDADVVDVLLANALEQGAHTGFVHFAAQEVVIGADFGDVGRGFAHAKADFQNQGGRAAKSRWRVECTGRIVQQVGRAIQFISLGLADGGAASAQHIAFDGAQKRHISGDAGGLFAFGRGVVGHGWGL